MIRILDKNSSIMAKAYRFDDDKPRTGSTVYAFRTLAALKEFANTQGPKGTMKYWEIPWCF